MKFKYLTPISRLRIKSFVNLLLLILILAVPSVVFAQEEEKAESSSDCSIPKDLSLSRPHPEGTPTTVKIGMFLIDIKEIKDVSQSYVADGFFNISWKDPRLSKKALGKSLKGCKIENDEIWFPNAYVVNARSREFWNKKLSVDDDGNARYQFRYVGELSSDLDFTKFPFDVQTLTFVFSSIGDDAENLKFEEDKERSGARETFSVEGWQLKLIEPLYRQEYHTLTGRYVSQIHFRISAERQRGFYIWKVLLPLFLIVMMAWAVFWIDPSQIGPQISLSAASVFTLIAYRFSMGFTLPRISYFTRVDIFIMYSTILVFLALGTAIATSRIASQGRKELAVKIEKWARIIYLVLFLIIIAAMFLV